MRECAKVCRDAPTAATLNRLGYRTGTGKAWRAHRMARVRHQYRLLNCPKGKNWLPLNQAAAQLQVSETVVKRLIGQGTLPASQAVPSAPWVIRRAALDLGAVQAAVQAVRSMRLHPRHQPAPTDEASGETSGARTGPKPPDGV